MSLESIEKWLEQYPFVAENIKFLGILLLAYIGYLITKKIVIRGIKKLTSSTKTEWDDILLNERFLRKIAFVTPLLIINYSASLIPQIQSILQRFSQAFIALIILLAIGSIITSVTQIYEKSPKFREKPIKGYAQVVKIILYIFGAIMIIGLLTGQSPWTLLGGIGALTAVIILVFKDTILSFVASIQISSYDLVKVGDWIEVPKFGADGDVVDIALHTIKVQNWDKTITVIPTYKLIEDSFKNWRGMKETGGRRIMRAIYLDQSSIKFCDKEMIEKFKGYQLIRSYVEMKEAEIAKWNEEKKFDTTRMVNGRRMTNIGTFRAYLKAYLQNRNDVNLNLTFLVRQLPPGPEGVPIQIYLFTNTTVWVEYEDIQSDIFDHILAIVQEFDLRIFQNPTGSDFKNLSK